MLPSARTAATSPSSPTPTTWHPARSTICPTCSCTTVRPGQPSASTRRVSARSSRPPVPATRAGATTSRRSARTAAGCPTSPVPRLVQDDTNNIDDVFLHDRTTGATLRVSVSSTGAQATDEFEGHIGSNVISADGGVVAFVSAAPNLVPGDSNDAEDLFVHDVASGQTTRILPPDRPRRSRRAGNQQADGRTIAWADHGPLRDRRSQRHARRVRPRPCHGRDDPRQHRSDRRRHRRRQPVPGPQRRRPPRRVRLRRNRSSPRTPTGATTSSCRT